MHRAARFAGMATFTRTLAERGALVDSAPDAALELARACPSLPYGAVEVRPVLPR